MPQSLNAQRSPREVEGRSKSKPVQGCRNLIIRVRSRPIMTAVGPQQHGRRLALGAPAPPGGNIGRGGRRRRNVGKLARRGGFRSPPGVPRRSAGSWPWQQPGKLAQHEHLAHVAPLRAGMASSYQTCAPAQKGDKRHPPHAPSSLWLQSP
jgi:hypothetical protein